MAQTGLKMKNRGLTKENLVFHQRRSGPLRLPPPRYESSRPFPAESFNFSRSVVGIRERSDGKIDGAEGWNSRNVNKGVFSFGFHGDGSRFLSLS